MVSLSGFDYFHYYDSDEVADAQMANYAKMLIPFEELRGVKTMSIRALARPRLATWVKGLIKAMKTPRSKDGEAARLEGWLKMGVRIVPESGHGSEKMRGRHNGEEDAERSSKRLAA